MGADQAPFGLVTGGELRRELLVDLRPFFQISHLQQGQHDRPADLFHLVVIYFVGMISGPVIVFMNSREPEDDRNAVYSVM